MCPAARAAWAQCAASMACRRASKACRRACRRAATMFRHVPLRGKKEKPTGLVEYCSRQPADRQTEKVARGPTSRGHMYVTEDGRRSTPREGDVASRPGFAFALRVKAKGLHRVGGLAWCYVVYSLTILTSRRQWNMNPRCRVYRLSRLSVSRHTRVSLLSIYLLRPYLFWYIYLLYPHPSTSILSTVGVTAQGNQPQRPGVLAARARKLTSHCHSPSP